MRCIGLDPSWCALTPLLLLSLFLMMPILLTACTSTHEIPPWFDAIHRVPVKTVVVEGNRIAYTERGEGSPVILVHGFGGSMWQWEYQQSLSAAHRVITLDVLGAGLSDKPDIEYTPTQLVSFMRDFLNALHISQASFVGNSMGAGIVIGMALTYPDRVDKLVLIDGFPDHVHEKLTSPSLRRALGPWPPLWMVKLGNWLAGRGTTKQVLSEMVYNDQLLTPAVVDRSNRNRQRPGLFPPLLATVNNLPLWENGFAKRLGEIRQPTLILWGEKDAVFAPLVGENLHRTIMGSRFNLIPDAGHIAMWERPDVVNPLLLKFLQP
ncbi:MAG TPA: alpha/beta hydrolase [Nitrospiraceae bacterium]|nr:alpha/beta hydrolase [Nitrospiraceae bacterium]